MTQLQGGQVELGTWGSLGSAGRSLGGGGGGGAEPGPAVAHRAHAAGRGLGSLQVNRKVGQFKKAGFFGGVEAHPQSAALVHPDGEGAQDHGAGRRCRTLAPGPICRISMNKG